MYGNIVLAGTKKGFVPNAIKAFTGSVFSHSLVTTPDILDIPMCMEAVEGGVDMMRFDLGYSCNQDQGYQVWILKIPQEVKDEAIKKLLSELEVGYGFLAYPWFMWRRLNFLFGKDIKAQNNWCQAGMICSQLCVEYLRNCGLDYIFKDYGKGSISPQDLQDIFTLHPELFEMSEKVRLS